MRDKKPAPNTQILSPAAEQAQRKLKMRRLKSFIAAGFSREEAMDLLVAESSRR